MKMKTTMTAATIAMAFTVSANAAAIALGNASFETGLAGTNGTPESGWFSFGTAAGGVDVSGGFWTDFTGRDGSNAGYAVQNSETDGVPVYQTVTFDAGVTYRFTVGLGTSSGAPKNDAKWALQIWDAGFSAMQVGTSGTRVANGNAFTDEFVDFTPTVTANYQVGVRNNGYVSSTGADNNQSTIFFDNARLVEVPEPSSTALLGLGGLALILRRRK